MTTSITCISSHGARERLSTAELLTDADLEHVAEETYRWIKQLREVRYGDLTFRERFTYNGDSLWWFSELYLHKMRHLERAVSIVAALDAARRRFTPHAIEIDAGDLAAQTAAQAFGAARGVPVTVTARGTPRTDQRWDSYKIGLTAALPRWRQPSLSRGPTHGRIAAFVHNAFWRRSGAGRPSDESYIGPVLDALEARLGPAELAYVGVGPRRNFRARRWWDPVVGPSATPMVIPIERFARRGSLKGALRLWSGRHELSREIVAGPAIRDAGNVDGVDLWPLLERELAHVALLQWPWSARAMDEAGAAIDALCPEAVVTYAEAGGWGRALVLEARRRGVSSVGIQHGFIYRHWLNYRHEPDEIASLGQDRGFPHPDRTLLFDGYSARHLGDAGRLPAESLRVTGNPRLDVLIPRFIESRARERAVRRAEFGATDADRVVVLAAKFAEVREDLPELFRAAVSLPSTRLVVKTHPAETEAGYAELAAGLERIAIVAAGRDLGGLLAAADAVVTKNSTVAIDALLLGLPSLVIGLPNNLSPFVEAGVMLGARRGEIRQELEAVLYDRMTRDRLLDAVRRFVQAERLGADGRAATRAADEILALTTRDTP